MRSYFFLIPLLTTSAFMLVGCTARTVVRTNTNLSQVRATNTNMTTVVNENVNTVVNADVAITTNTSINTNISESQAATRTYTNNLYGFSLQYMKDFEYEESIPEKTGANNNYLLLDLGFTTQEIQGANLRVTVIDHPLSQWNDLDSSLFGTVSSEQQDIGNFSWRVLNAGAYTLLAIEHDNRTYVVSLAKGYDAQKIWEDAYNLLLQSFSFAS